MNEICELLSKYNTSNKILEFMSEHIYYKICMKKKAIEEEAFKKEEKETLKYMEKEVTKMIEDIERKKCIDSYRNRLMENAKSKKIKQIYEKEINNENLSFSDELPRLIYFID